MASILAACFGLTLSVSAEFTFQKADRVAIVGNALAARMQHHGWMEAALQQHLSNKQLVFRNFGFPGDTITKRPRSKDFTTAEEYLKHVEADVIFVMFGYNESFEGEGGLDTFKKNYGEMIDRYRALKPNGESEPRFVLFSPIAHENLGDPNLPDGSANNARLALYSLAISNVAKAKGVSYVDLFQSSQRLYDTIAEPLTINGIHLKDSGNRYLSEVIAKQLLGKNAGNKTPSAALLEAVLDKNYHWFNRFRAVDGNDIWGGRSGLKFTDDQTNREVLQHELVMLDVMTDNRDPKIWARANGVDQKVDDSNVPAPVPVISNVGGRSRSSNAQKEGNVKDGTITYQSGGEGLSSITVREGFEVNLFADEKQFPELVNPVQMNVDPKGRLWVAAWPTYPKWEPMKEMNDALLILPDEDRDGKADKVITFAKIDNPLGFEFWNGGVIVASQPNLIFLKDTDGDDIADHREVLLQGIGSADTHHAANNLIYGPDGGIYWQSGIFLHNNIEHPWGKSLSTGSSAMYRFDPRQYTIALHAGNSPNPHGISFDKWGYHYANDGTGGRAYQVRPEGTGFKMHKLLDKEVRPVPANEVVSSANFPDDMQGDYLICNTIGFLGIKQYDMHRNGFERQERRKEETVTVNYEVGEVWGTPKGDLIVSSDKNFRPADAVFGSDGGLYVADWHNVIIGHMQHNVRDPNRDHKHGRVYRVTAKGRPLQADVKIAGQPIPTLLKALEHPIDGVRYRARVELSARDSKAVIAACKAWMVAFDSKKKEHAHHLLEALWLHQQHNVRNIELLTAVLASPEPHARIAATTVQHHWYTVDPTKVDAPEEQHAAQKSGIIAQSDTEVEVRVGTVVEKLQFDLKSFAVKSGKKVTLTFTNPDYMPHNIVFVKPGQADAVGQAAMVLGAKGFDQQWVPKSDAILAASKLIDNRGEDTISFQAPAEPGDYQYVCTFPGHHFLMRGIMKVTE